MGAAQYQAEIRAEARRMDRQREGLLASHPVTTALLTVIDAAVGAVLFHRGMGHPLVSRLSAEALACEWALTGPHEVDEENQKRALALIWQVVEMEDR